MENAITDISDTISDTSNNIYNAVNTLFKNLTQNYIFVYTPPKVGSTTLVSSLRISLRNNFNIIHIHDEIMLNVLTGIKGIKIMDIINYLSKDGKTVFVIDVYRSPIERKISEFFEKISPYHFNNSNENISNYPITRITERFNKVFPYLDIDEHYFKYYNIEQPIPFDFNKKYTIQLVDNVQYIKLRLCDSNHWASILSDVFKTEVVLILDYKTDDKVIGNLYNNFKNEYKLPINYFDIIKDNKYLNFYYSADEISTYLNTWKNKLCQFYISYTETEYKFYINLCLENQYLNDIRINHYIDNGCLCKLCSNTRTNIFLNAKKGKTHFKKIVHNEVIKDAKKEYFSKIKQQLLLLKNKQHTPPHKLKQNNFVGNFIKK